MEIIFPNNIGMEPVNKGDNALLRRCTITDNNSSNKTVSIDRNYDIINEVRSTSSTSKDEERLSVQKQQQRQHQFQKHHHKNRGHQATNLTSAYHQPPPTTKNFANTRNSNNNNEPNNNTTPQAEPPSGETILNQHSKQKQQSSTIKKNRPESLIKLQPPRLLSNLLYGGEVPTVLIREYSIDLEESFDAGLSGANSCDRPCGGNEFHESTSNSGSDFSGANGDSKSPVVSLNSVERRLGESCSTLNTNMTDVWRSEAKTNFCTGESVVSGDTASSVAESMPVSSGCLDDSDQIESNWTVEAVKSEANLESVDNSEEFHLKRVQKDINLVSNKNSNTGNNKKEAGYRFKRSPVVTRRSRKKADSKNIGNEDTGNTVAVVNAEGNHINKQENDKTDCVPSGQFKENMVMENDLSQGWQVNENQIRSSPRVERNGKIKRTTSTASQICDKLKSLELQYAVLEKSSTEPDQAKLNQQKQQQQQQQQQQKAATVKIESPMKTTFQPTKSTVEAHDNNTKQIMCESVKPEADKENTVYYENMEPGAYEPVIHHRSTLGEANNWIIKENTGTHQVKSFNDEKLSTSNINNNNEKNITNVNVNFKGTTINKDVSNENIVDESSKTQNADNNPQQNIPTPTLQGELTSVSNINALSNKKDTATSGKYSGPGNFDNNANVSIETIARRQPPSQEESSGEQKQETRRRVVVVRNYIEPKKQSVIRWLRERSSSISIPKPPQLPDYSDTNPQSPSPSPPSSPGVGSDQNINLKKSHDQSFVESRTCNTFCKDPLLSRGTELKQRTISADSRDSSSNLDEPVDEITTAETRRLTGKEASSNLEKSVNKDSFFRGSLRRTSSFSVDDLPRLISCLEDEQEEDEEETTLRSQNQGSPTTDSFYGNRRNSLSLSDIYRYYSVVVTEEPIASTSEDRRNFSRNSNRTDSRHNSIIFDSGFIAADISKNVDNRDLISGSVTEGAPSYSETESESELGYESDTSSPESDDDEKSYDAKKEDDEKSSKLVTDEITDLKNVKVESCVATFRKNKRKRIRKQSSFIAKSVSVDLNAQNDRYFSNIRNRRNGLVTNKVHQGEPGDANDKNETDDFVGDLIEFNKTRKKKHKKPLQLVKSVESFFEGKPAQLLRQSSETSGGVQLRSNPSAARKGKVKKLLSGLFTPRIDENEDGNMNFVRETNILDDNGGDEENDKTARIGKNSSRQPSRPRIDVVEETSQKVAGVLELYIDSHGDVIRKIEIIRIPDKSLGFFIRNGNGIDRADGIFISRVTLGSFVDENNLLHYGDEILQINKVLITLSALVWHFLLLFVSFNFTYQKTTGFRLGSLKGTEHRSRRTKVPFLGSRTTKLSNSFCSFIPS